MPTIQTLTAREIFDSRGTPTIEVDATLSDGSFGRASVPSGASTGEHEAVELRDADPARLEGTGVTKAVAHVEQQILPALASKEAVQADIDRIMTDVLDTSANESQLGANAILGVSMAVAKAVAASRQQPLWEYFRSLTSTAPTEWLLPVPMMNVLNGGKHATNSSDFQEFMIMPVGAQSFQQAMEMGVTVFMHLKEILHESGQATTVGDEGGFAPQLPSNQAAVDLMIQAVTAAGYQPGKEIVFATDVAASEFYQDGHYHLARENRDLSATQMIELYESWLTQYPIASIEDGLDEDAWADNKELTARLGDRVQLVGDDLFVTNVERLQRAIDEQVGNAILIKLNQIGSVSKTVAAIDLARRHGYKAIVSHRSGETEDSTIADFVVGMGTGQIKTGSLSRSDRMAKYNQLLRIEERLGAAAQYPGLAAVARH